MRRLLEFAYGVPGLPSARAHAHAAFEPLDDVWASFEFHHAPRARLQHAEHGCSWEANYLQQLQQAKAAGF